MPSTRLTDLETELANKWLEIRDAYESAHQGCRLVVTATYRSPEEQQELYKVGRVEKRGIWILDNDPATQIVTQVDGRTRLSLHNSQPAKALDFCLLIAGKCSWRLQDYVPVGQMAQRLGLRWGGTWDKPAEEIWDLQKQRAFIDAPHIELVA